MTKKRLSLRVKLGFGICDLGGNLFFTLIGFYLLYFLTDVLHMNAGLAGTALMIGKIWDAVTDPAVGYLSDRTRSKWGRRRPYIFWGAIALFLTMIAMFINPGIRDQGLLFVWVTIMYCLLNTALTLVNIPYGALTPELTSDFNERTVLNGYRMSFAVIGTLCGAGLVFPLVGAIGDKNWGWTFMGGVMGAIMMVTALVTFFVIREPKHEKPEKQAKIVKTYLSAFASKPFRTLIFPWALHTTGVTVIQGALLYYFRYIFKSEAQFQIALLFLLMSSIIFIPVWVQISKRLGKKLCYNIGMIIFGIAVLLFFLFANRFGVIFAFIIMGSAGIGFATHYVMPWAMLPDVVDYDYAENHVRREGVFYGMWTFTSKVGQAIAIAISGWVLNLFGYVPNVEQSESSILGIRLLAGPITLVFLAAGIIVLCFYPITRAVYEQILIKMREQESSAT